MNSGGWWPRVEMAPEGHKKWNIIHKFRSKLSKKITVWLRQANWMPMPRTCVLGMTLNSSIVDSLQLPFKFLEWWSSTQTSDVDSCLSLGPEASLLLRTASIFKSRLAY